MQGDELKALRKRAGLTQAELGDALDLTGAYVGEMERGEKKIERRTEMAVKYLALLEGYRSGRIQCFDEDDRGELNRNTSDEAMERLENRLLEMALKPPRPHPSS
jgi:transcriptional regulator with XRE-family HTH domain